MHRYELLIERRGETCNMCKETRAALTKPLISKGELWRFQIDICAVYQERSNEEKRYFLIATTSPHKLVRPVPFHNVDEEAYIIDEGMDYLERNTASTVKSVYGVIGKNLVYEMSAKYKWNQPNHILVL